MRASSAALIFLYLLPPAALVGYVVWVGDPSGLQITSLIVRSAVCAIGSVVVGIALAEKVAFLRVDGASFYIRYFIFYAFVFLLLSFLLGFETYYPDQHRTWRYSY